MRATGRQGERWPRWITSTLRVALLPGLLTTALTLTPDLEELQMISPAAGLVKELTAPITLSDGTSERAKRQLRPEGQFAFAGLGGTVLLALEDEGRDSKAKPRWSRAICQDNTVLSVSFEAHQLRRARDNGRARGYNLENMEGDRYRVARGKAEDDRTCLLTNEEFFAGQDLLEIRTLSAPGREPGRCSAEAVAQLAERKRRSVRACWKVAALGPQMDFLVADFDRRKDDLLAVLAVHTGARLLLHDLPAKYDPQTVTGWRVGDQGVIHPNSFEILFALRNRRTGSLNLGVEWVGEEGGSEMLLRAFGDELRQICGGYRYWQP